MIDILIIILGIVALICIWIILYDSNRFVVVRHALADPRIKKPFRAVVLADLHNKRYGRENELLLSAIEEQEPDAVIIAGDLLTARKGEKFKAALGLLEKLKDKYPLYYANGNHEHRLELYPEVYGSMAEDYEKELTKLGIHRLVNEHVSLEQTGIVVYGVQIDRKYYQRFRKKPMPSDYLTSVLGRADQDKYCVLIAHNPDYFPEYAAWGADLVFSGHIHGGLVRIPGGKGLVSPAVRFFPHYDGGRFQEGSAVMLLSRGLGTHTIPIRMFNPGELLVVELAPAAEELTPTADVGERADEGAGKRTDERKVPEESETSGKGERRNGDTCKIGSV